MAVGFSIVLPCYNEAESLAALLARYERALAGQSGVELILVDNGSTDDTPAVLAHLLAGERFPFARTVRIEQNRGYGHGIMTGLREAHGTLLGFSHADMQCPPEDLLRARERLEAAPDPRGVVVKGRRTWRGPGAAIITGGMSIVATLALRLWLTDINAQPKVFHRSLLDALSLPPDGFEFDLYVLYRARQSGRSIVTIPVVFEKRAHGRSRWAYSLRSRARTMASVTRYTLRLGAPWGRR